MRFNKSFLLFLGVVFFSTIIHTSAFAEDFKYENELRHYSITLPNNWDIIPKKEIDEAAQVNSKFTGTDFVDYATGFYKTDQQYFDYPYLLVQEKDLEKYDIKLIEQLLAEEDLFSDLELNNALINNTDISEPKFDKKRNAIYMTISGDTELLGTIKGINAMFFGIESSVTFSLFTLEDEYTQYLPDFISIINSFEFEKAYQYPTEIERKKAKELVEYTRQINNEYKQIEKEIDWERWQEENSIYIYTAMAAIIGVIIVLIFRKKKDS